jgi:phospholipid transport system substrate-binding protein
MPQYLAMTSARFSIVALTVALMLLAASDAVGGAATDQIRGSIDLVLKILADPDLKKESKSLERRRAIRAVANEIFDFGEISRRSLALHWQARTPAERQEFILLFGDLLEQSYISKIENYSGEKIQYVGETVDGDRVVVRTLIVTKQGTAIPVDYRMSQQGERWRAYDVTLEGVSLVANYRAQFNTIIQRSGYPDLVAKLRVKYNERPGPRETGSREDADRAAATAPPPGPARQSP